MQRQDNDFDEDVFNSLKAKDEKSYWQNKLDQINEFLLNRTFDYYSLPGRDEQTTTRT